jgi:type II secretory pathway component HofQ
MITMQFQDVPLLMALQLICDAANLDYTVGDNAVVLSPLV